MHLVFSTDEGAGDVCTALGEVRDETMTHQEVQGPIDRRRVDRPPVDPLESVTQLIRRHGPTLAKQQRQELPALRRQPDATLLAARDRAC